MLAKTGVKTRLLTILLFAIFNVTGVGGMAIYYLSLVVKSYGHLASVNMPALKAINEARNAQRDIVIQDSVIAVSEHMAEDEDKVQANFEKAVEHYEEATKTYRSLPAQKGEEELRASVDKGWLEFLEASKKMIALSTHEEAKSILARKDLASHELAEARKHFRDSFQALAQFHDQEAQKWQEDAKHSALISEQVVIGSTVLGGLLVLLIGYQVAAALAKALSNISVKISETSNQTGEATEKVSSASDQLASSSTQQASSIQETAAAMEEISAMVSKNASTAETTRNISIDSQQKAADGQKVVLAVVAAIEEISQSNLQIGTQIENSNRELTEITRVIAEIESKTKVINDIVFQTKLLSFNASVEAARAGEHGKGFAVVAEEVGNLAQMSGSASHSISEILRDGTQRVQDIIQRSSSQIEKLITDNKAKIASGVATAEACRKVLEELVKNVNQVTEMASNIAVASQEQAHGVREVNTAISQFSAVVEQTNASSQDLSNASVSLVTQTDSMNAIIRELASVVNGSGENKKVA